MDYPRKITSLPEGLHSVKSLQFPGRIDTQKNARNGIENHFQVLYSLRIEKLANSLDPEEIREIPFEKALEEGKIRFIDPRDDYLDSIMAQVDLDAGTAAVTCPETVTDEALTAAGVPPEEAEIASASDASVSCSCGPSGWTRRHCVAFCP